MRKISADYIFPIASEPIKKGVITIDDSGLILNVESEIENPKSEIEYYEGVICPGFINTHCHLELSHMRSKVSENAGMTGFIKELLSKRFSFSEDQIQQAVENAETEMIKNGIVAVGDISNNNSTFKQKAKGNLVYHTFIEAFDFNPNKADEVFANSIDLTEQLQQLEILNIKLPNSIVPHAAYSVSEKLFKLIADKAIENNSIISIHNQESLGESELFISKSGPMFEAFSKMGINMDLIPKTGVNSLRTTLHKLPLSQKILLVHNTFTSREDILWAKSKDLFWCTCPNANIYIENKLPDYNYFIESNARITIGTDSLASNWSLSILDELKTIVKQYPQISLHILLIWATKNGADFLGLEQLGTIEKGKKPGLNLLKNMDGIMITEKTEVVKLV
jgi:cytosine/adenosine deaminase-related metal-dependent hydrolase